MELMDRTGSRSKQVLKRKSGTTGTQEKGVNGTNGTNGTNVAGLQRCRWLWPNKGRSSDKQRTKWNKWNKCRQMEQMEQEPKEGKQVLRINRTSRSKRSTGGWEKIQRCRSSRPSRC
jgi:hypothetical protein